MKAAPLVFSACLLAGCALPTSAPQGAITPQQAIALAAEAAGRPVHAVVALRVQAVGSEGRTTYLNSEPDYRDQRNISLAIAPEALQAVEAKFGGPLGATAVGKRLRVEGAARRVTIGFLGADGKPTGKYYYQTHLLVVNAAQIELL